MARKKRKKRPAPRETPSKKPEAFNPAFAALQSFEKGRPPSPDPPKAHEPVRRERDSDGSHTFLAAMTDVKPLQSAKRTVLRAPNADVRPAHPAPDDELEVMAYLSDLVAGNAEMDVTFSDEYIEGAVPGFSQKLMKRLKRGEFPTQDYRDLHGLTQQEAELAVQEFLLGSYRLGRRCVLLVHGRGLNSENNIPVLKERLPGWLTRGPVKKIVLAFSTARPYDGGTGAVYVLLKKPKAGAVSLSALQQVRRKRRE